MAYYKQKVTRPLERVSTPQY